MKNIFTRDSETGECEFLPAECLENKVVDIECRDGVFALIYTDGSEKITTVTCENVEDTRLNIGESITNGDGSITIPYMTTNALTGEIVDTDEITIPADETVSTAAAGANLVRGLSKGQVNKPVNVAASKSDLDYADPNLEVSYASMMELFSNAAIESDDGGVFKKGGMMNTDGSLGSFQKHIGQTNDGGTIPLTENNAWGSILWTDNGEVILPDGRYVGQTIHIFINGSHLDHGFMKITTESSESFVSGVARNENGRIEAVSEGEDSIYVRTKEWYQLVWTGSWNIQQFNYRLQSGIGWHENIDGTVTIHTTPSPINPAAYPAFTIFPPISNGTNGMSTAIGGQY